ncbi:hypothetical protein K435DRAFT_459211 [Dendrothele bispora CBS 962.96]|uniref:Uncharacterized protein n=1 Tax=Dendrothele bispora (strain CBS 962.96) TaxID=1314807 RepID=A0A4S8ME70_DENBC|nr:hypothetical protein K435DRAFT_459211 [Dendrothele bispora CBS 962.96]
MTSGGSKVRDNWEVLKKRFEVAMLQRRTYMDGRTWLKEQSKTGKITICTRCKTLGLPCTPRSFGISCVECGPATGIRWQRQSDPDGICSRFQTEMRDRVIRVLGISEAVYGKLLKEYLGRSDSGATTSSGNSGSKKRTLSQSNEAEDEGEDSGERESAKSKSRRIDRPSDLGFETDEEEDDEEEDVTFTGNKMLSSLTSPFASSSRHATAREGGQLASSQRRGYKHSDSNKTSPILVFTLPSNTRQGASMSTGSDLSLSTLSIMEKNKSALNSFIQAQRTEYRNLKSLQRSLSHLVDEIQGGNSSSNPIEIRADSTEDPGRSMNGTSTPDSELSRSKKVEVLRELDEIKWKMKEMVMSRKMWMSRFGFGV